MPVITISRQFGSYGDAVAELLSDRLGCRILDKSLLRRIGAQLGVKVDRQVESSEDQYRPWSLAERLLSSGSPPTRNPAIWAQYASVTTREQAAAEIVARLIHAAYEMGDVIVVGRGGQIVLRDKPDVLHVRLTAPLAIRIRRHQVRAGLTAEAAREEVIESDRGSADFIKRYYDADIDALDAYDLIINTARLPLAGVADLIVEALAALPSRADAGGHS